MYHYERTNMNRWFFSPFLPLIPTNPRLSDITLVSSFGTGFYSTDTTLSGTAWLEPSIYVTADSMQGSHIQVRADMSSCCCTIWCRFIGNTYALGKEDTWRLEVARLCKLYVPSYLEVMILSPEIKKQKRKGIDSYALARQWAKSYECSCEYRGKYWSRLRVRGGPEVMLRLRDSDIATTKKK